jgi:hypothetical protein
VKESPDEKKQKEAEPFEPAPYYRGGGGLFGDPESKPKNSYRCPKHGLIPSSEVDWQGVEAHCPHCGQKLETSASR